MTQLHPLEPLNLKVMILEHDLVAVEDVVSGHPSTATVALNVTETHEVGVWEMSKGSMTDVETDEIFVVLSGKATIGLLNANGVQQREVTVSAGSLCSLTRGMRTRWTVTETLRKVYIMSVPPAGPADTLEDNNA